MSLLDKTLDELPETGLLTKSMWLAIANGGAPLQKVSLGALTQFLVGPLFVELEDYDLPADMDVLYTSGFDREGWGGAPYRETANVGKTRYRTQIKDGRWFELDVTIPHLGVFGAHPSLANNDDAIEAALAWAGVEGRRLLVLPGRYTYLSRHALPRHLVMEGAGWESVLAGPGFDVHGGAVDGAGFVTYTMRNPVLRHLTFDGEAYVADGIGIDHLGVNFSTIEFCQFLGFKYQIVQDVVQRPVMRRNRHHASAGTIAAIFMPSGEEVHAGVDDALHPTNVVVIHQCHFDWTLAPTTWPVIHHRGLQFTFTDNQLSGGRAGLRLGGVSGMVLGTLDSEFSTTYAIETVSTDLAGLPLASTVNIVTLTPGSYFDKPLYIPHAKALYQTAIDFFISGGPAVLGTANVRMIVSIGCKNNRTGGTILEALPTVSGAQVFQRDEEQFQPVRNDRPLSLSPPFEIADTIAGVLARVMMVMGGGRLEGRRDSTATWAASSLNGYVQTGTQNGLGMRHYSGFGPPDDTTCPGAPPGISLYVQLLDPATNYAGEFLIWIKNPGDTTWRRLFEPLRRTVAQFLAIAPTDGRQGWVTDRHRPCWGNSTTGTWQWADGTDIS